MQIVSEFHLQAKPDFSSFWFPVGGNGETWVYLNFVPQKEGIVGVSIERHHLGDNSGLLDRDVDVFFYGLLLGIEFYSGLYPNKCLLFKSDDEIQSIVFRTMLRSYRDMLERVFSFHVLDDKGEIDWSTYGEGAVPAFTLKRLGGTPSVKADLSNYKYNVQSVLFDLSVTVQMLVHFHGTLN